MFTHEWQVLRCKMLSDEFSSRAGPELQRLLAVEESRYRESEKCPHATTIHKNVCFLFV
jgi:hypothetical protein